MDAFDELVRRNRWAMLYVASGVLQRQEDAEDAVQAALWSAFRYLATFRRESSFKTWLTSITLNHARMRRRELARAAQLFCDETAGAGAAEHSDSEGRYATAEMVEALHREIRLLPAKLRQVMLLHVESYSASELATRLGLTLPAAKARLFRARLRLQSRMRAYVSSTEVAA